MFWDLFGEMGHPIRATVAEMGPLLLSRILNLNDTQSGVLTAVFKIADDKGLLLLDLKDLRALLAHGNRGGPRCLCRHAWAWGHDSAGDHLGRDPGGGRGAGGGLIAN